MIFIKKKRHKPLYKKFIYLRKNVQNRYKILKFKKRKWEILVEQLKRLILNEKKMYRKTYRMYDLNRYHIPKYYKFKRKFSYHLLTKKRFKLFYGDLLQKYLKNQVKLAAKKPKNFLNLNKTTILLELFEKRLDTILYRSHFTLSIRAAKQLISHGHVSVNNTIIKNSSYILKKGDLIKLNPKIHIYIYKNFENSNLWPLPPKYLQTNYKTFQIIVIDNIENTNFSIYFPFYPNIQRILKEYSL